MFWIGHSEEPVINLQYLRLPSAPFEKGSHSWKINNLKILFCLKPPFLTALINWKGPIYPDRIRKDENGRESFLKLSSCGKNKPPEITPQLPVVSSPYASFKQGKFPTLHSWCKRNSELLMNRNCDSEHPSIVSEATAASLSLTVMRRFPALIRRWLLPLISNSRTVSNPKPTRGNYENPLERRIRANHGPEILQQTKIH